MPRIPRTPKYRHYKPKNLAVVRLNGQDHYLGRYGSDESRERYDLLIGEWLANHRTLAPRSHIESSAEKACGDDLSIAELALAFLRYAQSYYMKDGVPTGHIHTVRKALRLLRKYYGRTRATAFGPLALRALQQVMIEDGSARSYINGVCGVIKRLFKWGVSQELIPVTVYQALTAVPGLKKGRSQARETPPVTPVEDRIVDATLEQLGPVVADMVRFQRLTGARPSEVCVLRPLDLDRSGDVWVYQPESHKTEHRDRQRLILIGPKAQQILTPYLLRATSDYCFSPAEADRKHREARQGVRKTPMSCGNRPGSNRKRKPKRKPGKRYTPNSYRQAIHRAVGRVNRKRREAAKKQVVPVNEVGLLPKWSPNQLRHSAATEIRKRFGLEAAQVTLGHATADVTQIYAERDLALASEVMRKIG